jgi:hypothetical protein
LNRGDADRFFLGIEADDGEAQGGAGPARHLKVGTAMVREHHGTLHEVTVGAGRLLLPGQDLSEPLHHRPSHTATSWNGPRFFGLRGGSGTEAAVEPVPVMKDQSRLEPEL